MFCCYLFENSRTCFWPFLRPISFSASDVKFGWRRGHCMMVTNNPTGSSIWNLRAKGDLEVSRHFRCCSYALSFSLFLLHKSKCEGKIHNVTQSFSWSMDTKECHHHDMKKPLTNFDAFPPTFHIFRRCMLVLLAAQLAAKISKAGSKIRST